MRSFHFVNLALTLVCFVGCSSEHDREEKVELAPFMSRLQLFSQKLGYSLKAENVELARFYLHELHEIVEEIEEKVPEHDGFAIAELVKATVDPSLKRLGQTLRKGTWQQRWHAYENTIATCNACHAATAHAFIHIRSAEGTPPFNQQFEPTPAKPK